jgi:hypothetical protein
VEPGSPCRIVLSPWRCGRPRRSDCDEVWAASSLRVVSTPTSSADSCPCALHVSRQAGQVVGGRRPRPRTVFGGPAGCWRRARQTGGAVRDCSRWLGRRRQPGPGLVADRTGLVALGAVEAIIRGWRRGVGHGDHPGSRSGWAARPAPRSGGTSRRRPGPLYPLPPAGSRRPAGDVISRSISPGSYGDVLLPLQRAAWPARQAVISGLSGMLEEPGRTAKLPGRGLGFPAAAIRERWRRPGWPRGAFRIRFRTPGASRILRPAELLRSVPYR